MDWTANNGLATLVKLFYDQREIKTFSQELRIVVNTAYYFSLIVIITYGAAEIYEMMAKKAEKAEKNEHNFAKTTKNALKVSFNSFIIFVAFFYFLLRNDGGTHYTNQMI